MRHKVLITMVGGRIVYQKSGFIPEEVKKEEKGDSLP
jgi:hypothetical protein